MEASSLFVGLIVGAIVAVAVYFIVRSKSVSRGEYERLQQALQEALLNLKVEEERSSVLRTEKERLQNDLMVKSNQYDTASHDLIKLQSEADGLAKTLESRKEEIENLRKQFNLEFENIATKILEEKSEKFTRLNRDNLHGILEPLKENIKGFREKVEEVYDKESKERFSLGNEVKRLVELNQQISEDANNLTKALKGESKTQGDWGEMILESILEKSGLVKDREYFVQETLSDEHGTPLKNESGSRMQPDVIIKCPDERNIVIDSKVSLTAYVQYVNSDEEEIRNKALSEHKTSVKRHVDELSKKEYHEYANSLNFVLMFIPNEPAYLLAMQADPDLWHYAYKKNVVLLSPTNLIATIRLIVDLWKKEYQSQNALEIADRGAKMYDKFVSFIESLNDIGTSIDKAQSSYEKALNQLYEGSGNLIGQAEKLKELGIKPKKEMKLRIKK